MTAPKITVTTVDENHPAALAFHALNDGLQILRGDVDDVTDVEWSALGVCIAKGVTQLRMLYELFHRHERTIEEQRVAINRETQYSTRVEEKNTELNLALIDRNERIAKVSRTLESLYAKATTDVQKSADYFTAIKTAREELDPSAAPRTPATEAPRRVAAGR